MARSNAPSVCSESGGGDGLSTGDCGADESADAGTLAISMLALECFATIFSNCFFPRYDTTIIPINATVVPAIATVSKTGSSNPTLDA